MFNDFLATVIVFFTLSMLIAFFPWVLGLAPFWTATVATMGLLFLVTVLKNILTN